MEKKLSKGIDAQKDLVCSQIFKQFWFCGVQGLCGELQQMSEIPSNFELCNTQRGTTEGIKTEEIQW